MNIIANSNLSILDNTDNSGVGVNRLSQNHGNRNRSGSSPMPPSALKQEQADKLSIEFEASSQLIIRPNRIIRGKVLV